MDCNLGIECFYTADCCNPLYHRHLDCPWIRGDLEYGHIDIDVHGRRDHAILDSAAVQIADCEECGGVWGEEVIPSNRRQGRPLWFSYTKKTRAPLRGCVPMKLPPLVNLNNFDFLFVFREEDF